MTSDEKSQLEAAVRRSLEELQGAVVPWVPAPLSPPVPQRGSGRGSESRKEAKGDGLSEDAVQVGDRICRFPEEYVEERCDALHFDRNREWRGRRSLDLRGMIQEAGRIGKQVIFEPTDRGKDWAKSRDISLEKYKSGTLHHVIDKRLEQRIQEAVVGVAIRRGGVINGVQPDQVAMLPGGWRVPVQICVSNSVEYEARNLLRLAEDPNVDRVLIVAVNREKAERIARAIQELRDVQRDRNRQGSEVAGGEREKEESGGGDLKKIVVTDAGMALGLRFDWASVIGSNSGGSLRPTGQEGPRDNRPPEGSGTIQRQDPDGFVG
jgi:hypothetical protein